MKNNIKKKVLNNTPEQEKIHIVSFWIRELHDSLQQKPSTQTESSYKHKHALKNVQTKKYFDQVLRGIINNNQNTIRNIERKT